MKDAIEDLWSKFSHLPPAQFQELLMELMPALVDDYGKVAATAAAEWYEATRAKAIGGSFTARIEQANLEAVQGSVKWAGGSLFGENANPEKTKHRITAAAQRQVHNLARETVVKNVMRDPSRPKWARAMRGRETCGWCRMLASRGFVYATEQTAGAGHAWGHDKCDCEAIPDFSLNAAERAEYDREVAALYDQYLDVRGRVPVEPAPSDEVIAAEWASSMIDYGKVRAQLGKPRLGATKDGTLQQHVWDQYRKDLLDRMERDYRDGYVATKRLPPRNPLQAPADWPSDLPALRAKEWNHILFGDASAGGHASGHGWVHDRDEFPREWSHDRILAAVEKTMRNGIKSGVRSTTRYRANIDGVPVLAVINNPKLGQPRILSAYPEYSR